MRLTKAQLAACITQSPHGQAELIRLTRAELVEIIDQQRRDRDRLATAYARALRGETTTFTRGPR